MTAPPLNCDHFLYPSEDGLTYLDPFLGRQVGSLYITDYKMYFKVMIEVVCGGDKVVYIHGRVVSRDFPCV